MKNLCPSFLKTIYYTIIILFVGLSVLALAHVIKMLYPSLPLSDCANFITAITALCALIVALLEYYGRKDVKQAQILSEYNKRYSEDPNIVKVVKYLNYIDDGGTINNPIPIQPSNYEVEMFMRFFEELEIQIESGRIEKHMVNDLFSYYAKKLGKNEHLLNYLGVTDYSSKDHDNWKYFKKLINKNN